MRIKLRPMRRGRHSQILRSVLVGVVSSGLTSWAAAASPPNAVSDVKVVNQADGTRVVLELSQATHENIFTLDNPARVVVDLSNTELKTRLPVGAGLVKNLRAASRGKGELRIVLDMTDAVQPRSQWLAVAGKSQLLLDLSVTNTQPATTSVAVTKQADAATFSPLQPQSQAIKTVSTQTNDLVIAVDAGHGGEDPGAIGRHGAQEKNVTLAIARLLKERIDAEPGMRAVLTRDGDYFVPLRERINRARAQQADMFISIHADSVGNTKASGSSVYTLSAKGATNEAARYLADRENAADLKGGVSLDDKTGVLASVLLDLTQGASMSASMDAAARVLSQLDRVGSMHHTQVQQAGFVVLKSPDIPSMLVETAFISNPVEEARLTDSRYQAHIADAVLNGVRDYFYTNTPPGSRIAQIKAMRQAANRP
jgi:N-acetylmuramoyl-L-alanine amidase